MVKDSDRYTKFDPWKLAFCFCAIKEDGIRGSRIIPGIQCLRLHIRQHNENSGKCVSTDRRRPRESETEYDSCLRLSVT